MHRREFLSTAGMTGLALALAAGMHLAVAAADEKTKPEAAEVPNRPNIIFILSDDQGIGDLTCYNPQSKLPSPHIDRLAKEGMRFTDAHSASAVCSPTRYGILTGRHPWRTTLQTPVLMPYDPPMIEKGRLTVGDMLRKQGYHTACIGKWHLGMDFPKEGDKHVFDRPIGEGPITRGFDYYFGVDVPNHPPFCFIENDRTVGIPTDFKPVMDELSRDGEMLPGWKFDQILQTLKDRAVRYIQERSKQTKPFFLYFALTSPHEPVAPSKAFKGKSSMGDLADFILETDAVVGEVLKTVDDLKLADNTLVIYAADNGHATYTGRPALEKLGQMPAGPYKGAKASVFEAGHRVPCLIRWPRVIPAGAVCDQTMCLNDFMATCAQITGFNLPDNAAEDSVSILPLFKDATKPVHEAVVHASARKQLALRRGPWKYIEPEAQGDATTKPKGEARLFNLQTDIGETKNVAADHPHIVAELAALLKKYRGK